MKRDNIVLENDFLKLELCKVTGAIMGIYDKQTQWQVIRQPELAMGLQLLVPLPKQRNHRALSRDQRVSGIEAASNLECRLYWEEIIAERLGRLDIRVASTITLKDSQITFALSVENNSGCRIDEVSYPCFGGVRPDKISRTFRTRTVNMCGGFQNTGMLSPFPQARGYWGTNYPTFITEYPDCTCMMPFELIELDGHGIYFGAYENEFNNMYFTHEFRPGFTDSKRNIVPESDMIGDTPAGYVFTLVRTPFLEPGEKYEFAPVVMNFYKGDWHEGIKPYIEWRQAWFEHKPQPAWLMEVDSWQSIGMTDPVGTICYTYKDLPDVAKEAKSKGVKALHIIGWNKGGLDGRLPYFETDPRLGTREEFKEVINEIEKSGIRTILLCKFNWADSTIPEFESEMKRFTVKDFYGKNELYNFSGYQTITGSGTAGAYLCQLSDEFRKFTLKQMENIIDLGVSGLQNDQITPGGYCFDTAHGHRWGESSCKGALSMAEEFYETARRLNSDFMLTGEGPMDIISQYYPLSYIRTSDYYYWVQKHLPVWKYINSDMMFSTCIIGWDDREMINQCLAFGYIINYEPYNFKGRLSDIPVTVEYGQNALELRRKLWDYIWLGKFNDTEGAEVEIIDGDKDSWYYTVFTNKQNGKKAVVIVNDHKTEPLSVKVRVRGVDGAFDVYGVDNHEIKGCEGNCVIPPRSLSVLVEKQ